MRFAKHIASIFIFSLLIGGLAFYVNAQNESTFITNPGAIRDSDINVDVSPEVPGPNQNVRITRTFSHRNYS